jgi:hypothetical protein
MSPLLVPGPPLEPSGEEGRRLLREELVHSEYHRNDLWNRLLDWVGRLFRGGVDVASGSSVLTALVTIVVVLLLLVGLILLLSRVRRDRRRRQRAEAVLPADRPAAAVWRRRADEALTSGRFSDAVDGFRALAAREVERGRLEDRPGATADEIAALLATSYDAHGRRIAAAADLFDVTLYGARPATEDQARQMLGLDDELAHEPVGAR